MKNKSLLMLITGVLILTLSGIAQEAKKEQSKEGVVVLKIKKSVNGKTVVKDTTFTIATPAGHKELEEYLSKQEIDLDNLSKDLEDIEVSVDMTDFSDSMASDSVRKQMKYIIKDFKEPRCGRYNNPEGYDYEFDLPCPPDFPPFPGDGEFEGEYGLGGNMRFFRNEDHRQTLSDIIGDIPMDRVKSYTIKDKKNGKRIIVDIDDAPLFEKHDKVIIIRDPGKKVHKNIPRDRQMKVIIKSDDGRQIEETDEPNSSSMPPPPPPPDKK